MSKKPKTTTRKPNAKTRAWYDAHPPVVVPTPHVCSSVGYSHGLEIVTSSRTQAPAKPVKPTRVRRPRNSTFMQVCRGAIMVTDVGVMDSSEARKHAAWLTHAAAYLEQEARRGKK